MKTILEKSRYLVLIGIIPLLVASVAAFVWGLLQTVQVVVLVISTLGADKSILNDLKVKLSSMVVLVMAIKFLEIFMKGENAQDIVWMGLAVALVSGALIAFGYFGKKE